MWIELFLSLVLAHLVADFVLQTGKTCKDKVEKKWRSMYHYGHAVVVFGLSWLVTWDVCFQKDPSKWVTIIQAPVMKRDLVCGLPNETYYQ